MSGDEIAYDYKGGVYSDRRTTVVNSTRRFSDSSYRLRTLHIRNTDAADTALIGAYNSSSSTFINNSYRLLPHYTLWLEYVDLYNLAYRLLGGFAELDIIGTY